MKGSKWSTIFSIVLSAMVVFFIMYLIEWNKRQKAEAEIAELNAHCRYMYDCSESLQDQINGLFTEYNLRSELIRYKVLYPDVVIKQARLETGNYTSNALWKYNNLFGFTSNGKLMVYTNWVESVKAYAEWQHKYYKPVINTEEEYYSFLKKLPYARDGDYIKKLKQL